MIRRLGPLFLLILVLHGGALIRTAAAQTPVPSVSIDVEGITVSLAPADADAFQRRLNQPPLFDEPPPASGPSYTVTTAYWDPAVREDEDEPAVEPDAEYFPAGGFVRARQDGQDVWLVLDLRQRAILDHYIIYGTQQRLPEDPSLRDRVLHPSALLVVFLAYYGVGETIAIEVGDTRLESQEVDAFLASIAPHLIFQLTFLDPPEPPRTSAAPGYWVTLTLPEGRTLQYFLSPSAGTLTDSLGSETFDIGAAAGGGIPESADVLRIQEEEPAGSRLWWLLAVGGGVSLLALAFAVHRRQPR